MQTSERCVQLVTEQGDLYPWEQVTIWMPAKLNGTGRCRLFIASAAADYFQLWQIPSHQNRLKEKRIFMDLGRTRKQTTAAYRIARASGSVGSKPAMTRFRLTSGHTRETLAYLSDYLNTTDVDWLWLTNRHGNRGLLHPFFNRHR